MLKYYNPLCWMGLCDRESDTVTGCNCLLPSQLISTEWHFFIAHFLALVQILMTSYFYYRNWDKSLPQPSRRPQSAGGGDGSDDLEDDHGRIANRPLSAGKSAFYLFQSADNMMGVMADSPGSVSEFEEPDTTQLILHQFPRGSEAPAGIDALRLESVIRILELEYKVLFDANIKSGIWISCPGKGMTTKEVVSGPRDCLNFVKEKFAPGNAPGWDIPQEYKVPAHFSLTLLTGDFPRNVTLYKLGLWKNGNQLKEEMKGKPEFELAGTERKEQLLVDIENSLDAFAASLGGMNFAIGRQLTVVDGYAFAILAQLVWSQDEGIRELIQRYPDLIEYTNGIRNLIWDDWLPPLVPGINPPNFTYLQINSEGQIQPHKYDDVLRERSTSTRTCSTWETEI